MTVNIAIVTSEAVVLGCDSVASVSEYFLDPFAFLETNPDGSLKMDAAGRVTAKFEFNNLRSVVTGAWGGVTKMFQIHPEPSPVAALTSGLAQMGGRTISSLAGEFFEQHKARKNKHLVNVEVICRNFLTFMRKRYDDHYAGSNLPPVLRDGPVFLIGGIGKNDGFPSLYRMDIQAGSMSDAFANGKTGAAWEGQSDGVERFIRGYDQSLKSHIEQSIIAAQTADQNNATMRVTDIVNNVLQAINVSMPAGIDTTMPPATPVAIKWDYYDMAIPYGNLPLQEAVNSVSFLVNLQAGRSRFARTVATVGGRVHIGVVTKREGFRLLNEPELAHRNTGFGDDV
jgi:hypothetical protein